jgi:hypothetical protein
MAASKQIVMTPDKACVHSIRFATEDPKSPVKSVYVDRSFPGIESAKTVIVTIEASAAA